jgi:hypothetical protein
MTGLIRSNVAQRSYGTQSLLAVDFRSWHQPDQPGRGGACAPMRLRTFDHPQAHSETFRGVKLM